MNDKVILGVYAQQENAEDALAELREAGFNAKDISIIMKDAHARDEMVETTGTSPVAEGATTGATTGAVVGGLAGLLVGIGALAIPGFGAVLIAGPIATALGLTGAAATTVSGALTGALAGGLVGGLISIGVPEEDARVYEQRINEGAILLAIPVTNENKADAQEILEETGADQIRSVSLRQYSATQTARV